MPRPRITSSRAFRPTGTSSSCTFTCFGTPAVFNAVVLVVLSAMIFVRVRYVYPSRTPRLRLLTVTLGWAWAAALALLIWQLPLPPRWLAIVSLAFPVYYTVLSLALNAGAGRARVS